MKHQDNLIELTEHMKMLYSELQKERGKPVKIRNYLYIKLLEQELGFELASELQEQNRHF
ncbi:MAG: hypothetical protein COA86_18655 [Kangiella sp.]|nr:MAG: hypothetical protein COA86_18655 [Kangiella sp.]